jgi:hypothetical protein
MNKGSFVDLLLIPWILFGVAIVVIICFLILDSLAGSPIDNGMITQTRNLMKMFDSLFLVVAIGLNIFVLISAWMVRSHPILFVLSVFFQMINVLLSEIVSDVYVQFANSAGLYPYASQFPLMYLFFQHLPVFSLMFGFLIALAMYARPQEGGGM